MTQKPKQPKATPVTYAGTEGSGKILLMLLAFWLILTVICVLIWG